MPPEIWFGPNVGSHDLLDLFTHPERWDAARNAVRTLQLYGQHIYLDHPNDPGAKNGPNCWPALVAAEAMPLLRKWKLNLGIEMAAVKPDDPRAEAHERTVIEAVLPNVSRAGGHVATIAMDEGLDAGLKRPPDGCGYNIATTVEHTARFMKNVKAASPGTVVGVIEPYPARRASEIQEFMEGLQQGGQSPAFLHLDVDRYGIRDQKIKDEAAGADLKHLQFQCSAWEIPFGVVLSGQLRMEDKPNRGVETAKVYGDDVLKWAQRLHQLLGHWPDHLVVQSWEVVGGALDVPQNLPEEDGHSHTGLVCAVRDMVRSTPA